MSKKQEEWLSKQMQSNLPFQLLQLERRRPENWGSAELAEYQRLVSLLKAENHEPKRAESLFSMADKSRSTGAARALRGTPLKFIRRKVIEQVVLYRLAEPDYEVPERPPPETRDGETPVRWPSYTMPLALGESDDDLAMLALIKALRFRAKSRQEVPIDNYYRRGAAESLGTVDHDDCRRVLLEVLIDSRDNLGVREACRDVLRRYPVPPELLARYRWLESTPERKALKRLACEEVGRLRALLTSYSRFRRVREDLIMLLGEASLRRSESSPRPIPAKTKKAVSIEQTPPTSPTKASPVAPAPPASSRQQPSERPKAGSDEGDSREPLPEMSFCEDCLRQLNQEGLLTPEQLEQFEPVPPRQCVRCSFE